MKMDETAAQAILEPYFFAAREEFHKFCVDQKLGNEVRRTRFECEGVVHDTPRHFAGTTLDGRLVVAALELADLPEDTVAAIFAHEFGHVVDHLYPGRFGLAREELVFYREVDLQNEKAGKARVARAKQWEGRSADEVELTADLLVERVLGHRVGYSGPCMLQGFNRGMRRPRGLR